MPEPQEARSAARDRYVVAEGDVRCNEPKDACKCLLPKGHDGPHECPHGYWTELVDAR